MSALLRPLFLLLALLAGASIAATDIPYLTGRVVDNAEILSPGTRQRLTALLREHEAQTTNQIVVLTVQGLGGSSVEEYAVKVFEAWKLGQKDKDNGVLVVIVPGELLAAILARFTRHLPSGPTTVETVWPWNSTVTVDPTSPSPKTGQVISRCSTMFDLKIGLTDRANAGATVTAPKSNAIHATTALDRHTNTIM